MDTFPVALSSHGSLSVENLTDASALTMMSDTEAKNKEQYFYARMVVNCVNTKRDVARLALLHALVYSVQDRCVHVSG